MTVDPRIARDDREADEVIRHLVRTRLDVLGSVPVLRPGFERPDHLAALGSVFERAHAAARGAGDPVYAALSAPSQVGKTSVAEVGCAWWLARSPQDNLGWFSYGQTLADDKSRRIRDDARGLAVELREDSTAVDRWQTKAGGGFLARGLDGSITGFPGLSMLIIDDPYRNRMSAESAAYRKRVMEAITGVVASRRGSRTSILLMHTRWTVDDAIGEMEVKHGPGTGSDSPFEFHRIPAVGDDGVPVVTIGGRDAKFWRAQRSLMGERDWWSIMQGRPRAREGTLFKGLFTYQGDAPTGRLSIGVDLAYSTKKSADYSVAVVLARVGAKVYVREVLRRQCSAPDFAGELKALRARYSGAPIRSYVGGTEKGTIDFLAREGLRITALPATLDKYARAVPCAAAWERGEVLVREGASWADAFVNEVADFTGNDGAHDDQVDALVAAFDALAGGPAPPPPVDDGYRSDSSMLGDVT